MMKLRLSAYAASALALALLATSASAQSYGAPAGAKNSVDFYSPADQWSGFYAGVHGGVVDSGRLPNPFGNTRAFEGGLQLGTNMQFGNFVVGAEAVATYSHDLRHDLGGGAGLRQSWSGAARAKAGIALDRVLVYGTAGYGVARLDPTGTVTSGAVTASGLVFGGGAELAVNEQLSLRLDYTQARYNGVAFTAGGLNQSRDIVDHSVRAGVNFRF
jgi:outer membrane immunogenic protein